MDVTTIITAHLTEAMRLAIAADGSHADDYTLIAQTTVNPDGTFVMSWKRYYSRAGGLSGGH